MGEPATHYASSNGEPRLISAMHTPHLANALAKLEREQPEERAAEITAMRAELEKRDAEKEESAA